MEMLKSSFMLAYQTTLTLLKIMVPRLPWSLDRFQTPLTVSTISSLGRTLSCLSSFSTELLSFRSRYSLELEKALTF